jgi:hypothetical protein
LTVPTVTPAIQAESVVVDATAGILTAPAVPASINYTNDIKIIEVYSNKILELSQKHASLT